MNPHQAPDWLTTHQNTCLRAFPQEMKEGLTAAFYGTFAIPRIAEILRSTGEMTNKPAKRAYDTGLVIYEIIAAGLDHERGREMIRLMNRAHSGLDIGQDLYTYVLCSFIVVPIRRIDRTAWRPTTDQERTAAARFYIELGRRMAIRTLPADWEQASIWLDDFEREHAAPSTAARELVDSTLMVVRDRLPRPLRLLTRQILATYFHADRTRKALGLPRPGPLVRGLQAALIGRQNRLRRKNPDEPGWEFTPGMAIASVYPRGYTLDQLGPDRARS